MTCRGYPPRIFFYYSKRLFMEATFGYPWDISWISLGYLLDILGISLGYPWDISWISFGINRVYPDSFLVYPMAILPDNPVLPGYRLT